MQSNTDKIHKDTIHSTVKNKSKTQNNGSETHQFIDNRPETFVQRKLQTVANNSPQVRKTSELQKLSQPLQKKENKTGLPDSLKSGIEDLSGIDMSDTRVHYNSSKPSQLQAHAYAQGTNIHIASGQEKHLPHEAWHVVQQKQGRVKPTIQLKGKVNINDDQGLENEADLMGTLAKNLGKRDESIQLKNDFESTITQEVNSTSVVVQRHEKSVNEIVDLIIQKVRREVGGGANPGLGSVPIGSKLGIACIYLRRDFDIRLNPKKIEIERVSGGDEFNSLTVMLIKAIKAKQKGDEITVNQEEENPDKEAVVALGRAIDNEGNANYDTLEEIIGSDPGEMYSSLKEHDYSFDDLMEADNATRLREYLTKCDLKGAKKGPSPEKLLEIRNEKKHLKRLNNPSDQRLTNVDLFCSLCDLLVEYSEGPDSKYKHSVKFSDSKLEIVDIARSQLNSAKDVGLGTANKGGSLEIRIASALAQMNSLVLSEFANDSTEANTLYEFYRVLKSLRYDLCNQDNAKLLVKPLNKIKPKKQ